MVVTREVVCCTNELGDDACGTGFIFVRVKYVGLIITRVSDTFTNR